MRGRGLRVAIPGKKMAQDKSAHVALCNQLTACGHSGFVTEYRFATAIERNWQWDIAYPERLLAIEVDGGIWCDGAHGHPVTIMRNMEKRNWAARLGWRVLAFDTKQAKNGEALAFIESVLQNITTLTTRESYAREQRKSRRWNANEVRQAGATLEDLPPARARPRRARA